MKPGASRKPEPPASGVVVASRTAAGSAPRVPVAFTRLPPDAMVARAAAHADAMATRRSVRHFSPEPFPRAIIDHAIRTAASAPSGAHRQPWTFVVIEDAALKRAVRDAAELEERKNWGGRMPAEWVHALEPLGLDWQKPHLTDAPVLIVVFAQAWSEVTAPDGTTQRNKHYYVDESVGIAVGLMLSALHLAGLSTLTHTASPMGFLRDLLGRPRSERAFVIVPVGYPAPGADVPDIQRRSLDDVRIWR